MGSYLNPKCTKKINNPQHCSIIGWACKTFKVLVAIELVSNLEGLSGGNLQSIHRVLKL
jgi:hypothetical protein